MVADGGVDPDDLGRAAWTFLHTLAATHPAHPTAEDAARISRFIHDFKWLYPCAPCAESFRDIVTRRPVENAAKSGPAFARWMCDVHNDVNKELGKPQFNCEHVADRWGVCESCARHSDKLDAFKKAFAGVRVKDGTLSG